MYSKYLSDCWRIRNTHLSKEYIEFDALTHTSMELTTNHVCYSASYNIIIYWYFGYKRSCKLANISFPFVFSSSVCSTNHYFISRKSLLHSSYCMILYNVVEWPKCLLPIGLFETVDKQLFVIAQKSFCIKSNVMIPFSFLPLYYNNHTFPTCWTALVNFRRHSMPHFFHAFLRFDSGYTYTCIWKM